MRPLLCVSRAEIETYIAERGIPTVYDSTNSDDRYLRNALRLHVLPLLEEMNPSVRQAISRTAQNIAEAVKVYDAAIDQQVKQILKEDRIDIFKLKKSPSPRSVLFEILTPLGFTPSVIEDITESLDAESGRQFLSDKFRVIKDRDNLLIVKQIEKEKSSFYIEHEVEEIDYPLRMQMKILEMPISIKADNSMLFADYDCLEYPLLLRRWKPGDWFIPLGMEGRKKLSDFFTDCKLSLRDKEETWILMSGGDVVWVVGKRMDNRYRVSNETKKVLRVKLISEKS